MEKNYKSNQKTNQMAIPTYLSIVLFTVNGSNPPPERQMSKRSPQKSLQYVRSSEYTTHRVHYYLLISVLFST